MSKYSIGVDFGTLSGRSLLVNIDSGEEVGSCVHEYKHGVMDQFLPDGTPLGVDWALQDPQDYLDVLAITIPGVIKQAGINNEDIVGIGIDFTGCTVLPLNHKRIPLSFIEEYKTNPHAYVKLWKHHAAQSQADKITEIAQERNETFLKRYGGKISSEWLFPKLLQILEEDPKLYSDIDCFIEASDWIVYILTGELIRNTCAMGYKAMWSKKEGLPSEDFFKAVNGQFGNVAISKIKGRIQSIGTKAGNITAEAANLTGLKPGTAVAVGHFDAAGSLVGAGISEPGAMLAVIGTSTCHIILNDVEKYIPGICGYVEDGMIPGYFGYEAGQSGVGDIFQWFVENNIPNSYFQEAENRSLKIQDYLSELACVKMPGESGLIALDWLNGNRSVLVNGRLSGVIAGLTLMTKPEDIYRSFLESTGFGTRKIIDTFEDYGVSINYLVASGGIPQKNSFMMQMYADILNKEVKISGSPNNCALSAAIWGAIAAGTKNGGYDKLSDAVNKMSNVQAKSYYPCVEFHSLYNQMYKYYLQLHDYFGDLRNPIMDGLKNLMSR